MKKLYFDYAATTPINKEVLEAMLPYFGEHFGNAGSIHSYGQEGMAALDKARETTSEILKTDFRGIIFTGSATEANNLILKGVVSGFYKFIRRDILPLRIIVSNIEHEAVLKTAEWLSETGCEIIKLPVDKNGRVNLQDLKRELNERTVLVSIMAVNNEVGSKNDIAAIAKIISDFRKEKLEAGGSLAKLYPIFHTDAVQSFQCEDVDFEKMGCDAITLSAHKFYGPKGVGILALSKRLIELDPKKFLNPIIVGGGQEYGMRSGTENIPGIVGMAKAMETAFNERFKTTKEVADLRNKLAKRIKEIYPEAKINGSDDGELDNLAPHILNVWFPNRRAEEMITKLDIAGLCVSAGSACQARAVQYSYVIDGIYGDHKRAEESLRFSIGKGIAEEDIDRALEIINSNK